MPSTPARVEEALQRPPARKPWDGARHAAVAAVFLPGGELLFMRRARHADDPWSGHVAFPGGHVDPTDATPHAAAVRETREELGVDLTAGRFLGELDELHTIGGLPALRIHPFVFSLDRRPDFRLNYEVRSVHTLSLDALLAGHGRGVMELERHGRTYTLARVDFDGVRLWGLTLRMVDGLLDRIDGRGIGLDRPVASEA